ncbi:hypothetical protein L228DRAFT_250317 [Xylona heveae TC161]|uniref:Zn(2)-C6 fungal-type domain-containing protein n=1 Tax=Xylona heveae (strain CBS 132557 / TC161) TaxID=1328760 RepID=A0A165A3F1_XYLHT|nr:hypothetical protein L228DRAFT_250317 [Xylona heveae TC161]KZF19898.1 hypothetical protein L228DRAFT_250317 [Xylona heveae TC161]
MSTGEQSSGESGPLLSSSQSSFSTEATLLSTSYFLRSKFGASSVNDKPFAAPPEGTRYLRSPDKNLVPSHSEAKGCKACLELGIDCPLLEEGSRYPCITCVEDGCDCELIIPPPRKRACEDCRRRRIRCSYRNGGDSSLPCEQCAKRGTRCIAGPARGSSQLMSPDKARSNTQGTGVSETFVEDAPALSIAVIVQPEQAIAKRLQEYNPQGLSTTTEAFKQSHNSIASSSSTLVPTESISSEHLAGETANTSPTFSNENGEKIADEIASALKRAETGNASVKIITTNFSHPISFNHRPENSTSPCHWCQNVFFGILGLGERRVTVTDCGNGNGYTEVSGGHSSNGVPPSCMCIQCTLDRLSIGACGKHTLKPISDLDPSAINFEIAFGQLLSGVSILLKESVPWCCICPSPAAYQCCAAQTADRFGTPLKPNSSFGCGLVVCETCAAKLTSLYDGDLWKLVCASRNDNDDYAMGLRADVEFLLPEGELMRQIIQQCI